jgi:hypothetical protein
MRTGNLLFSAVQFVFVVILFLLGGFFIGLKHAPLLCSIVARFFSEQAKGLTVIGYALVGCAFLLLCGFYAMNRRMYYQVKMKGARCEVDSQLIRSYVQGYWNEIFPDQSCQTDVLLHVNQQIEVFAEMPGLPIQEQQVLLSQIEVELGSLLARTFGYHRDFLVTVVLK